MKLSQRLAAVAAYVPSGSTVADIGTDHAYLPVYLVNEGIAPQVIATDVHRKPYESARETVAAYRLQDRISVRLGDGLETLQPGEAGTIVIAGMGGKNMVQIFRRSPGVLETAGRLILQPMTHVETVRQWLWANGWYLLDEDLVAEDGHLYEILVVARGEETPADPEIGPRLLEKRHPLLKKLLVEKEKHYLNILEGIKQSTNPETKGKAGQIREKLSKIQRVKQWLAAKQSTR